jgi:hypothetical protein
MRVCQFRHFGTVKSGVERQTDLIGHAISLGLQMDCNTRVGFVESMPETGSTRESSLCNPCVVAYFSFRLLRKDRIAA